MTHNSHPASGVHKGSALMTPNGKSSIRAFYWLLPIAGIAILAVLPYYLSSAYVGLAADALVAGLFAMSFNMLYGQAGMLSFGHGAYLGIGTFAAIHAMQAAETSDISIPTPLIPLAGGLAAMIVGCLVGLLATRRTGVYFALITVAFAQIMLSIATPFDLIFGGEGGISAWRPAWLGFDFGDITQVYYLTLFWVVICIIAIRYWIGTPLGRAAEAIRDNDERLAFLGYDVHIAKTLIFSLACLFAGVAGALMAINRESATYLVFSDSISAEVVLNSFIGGIGVFLGPAVGAAIMTLAGNIVSDMSRSWPLYQGILFVLIVMYMPTGILGLAQGQWQMLQRYGLAGVLKSWILFVVGAALVALAIILAVELGHAVFDTTLIPATDQQGIGVLGVTWNPESPFTWAIIVVSFAVGISLCRWSYKLMTALAQRQTGGR
ncbi:MAG: branched-chain amino acid ABC transporter permease [Rhizobiaceae bacterium]|nr:branched-chain amino acid ABC transporter permease [Rhizobiaceae bacterium]